MVIAKGSVSLKKAGLITIALVLVAAGVIVFYQLQGSGQKLPMDRERGTMVQRDAVPVKEYIRWKKYYM